MKLNIRRIYDGKDCPVEFEWDFVDEAAARQTFAEMKAKESVNFGAATRFIVSCGTFDGKRITPEELNQLIRGEYWYLFQFLNMIARHFGSEEFWL